MLSRLLNTCVEISGEILICMGAIVKIARCLYAQSWWVLIKRIIVISSRDQIGSYEVTSPHP